MHPEIGFSEILLILVVAVVVVGPKELPGLMRTLGRWMNKLRVARAHAQGIMQATVREAELQELADTKSALDTVSHDISQTVQRKPTP